MYRELLNGKVIKLIKDHPPFSPVLKLLEFNGQKVIWKDYSSRANWIKNTWGKWLINHECSILKRLTAVKGVPRLIQRLDNYGFLAEYLEGEPLNKFKPATLPFEVFKSLNHLIQEIHNHGVVHLDLGQRRNILIGKKYQPYFVDFANALYFRTSAYVFRQLFNLLCLIDRNALLKFKHRLFPQLVTDREKWALKWFFFSRQFWIFKPKKYRTKDEI